MGIRRLETTAVGQIFKEQHKTSSLKAINMYFVKAQFYQIPSDGLFSLISSLLGQKSTSTKSSGPSLLELHLLEMRRRGDKDRNKLNEFIKESIYRSQPILNSRF